MCEYNDYYDFTTTMWPISKILTDMVPSSYNPKINCKECPFHNTKKTKENEELSSRVSNQAIWFII